MDDFIGKNSSDKHTKYKESYGKNEIYWGIGLENELYLEFDKKCQVDKNKFLNNHKRERYSVDYYKNYVEEFVNCGFLYESFIDSIELPVLLNSHSLTKTDKMNQSKTLYTKLCEPNPKFCGETLWELAMKNAYLAANFQGNFTFDGDTIEVITQNFYNTQHDSVIEEYKQIKKDFIGNLRSVFSENKIFPEYGEIGFQKNNHQFALYLTNFHNIGIFNNGTLHFNITLPTKLGEDGYISNKAEFVNIHKNYIKLIQFMEPFFLAKFGSPDKFSTIPCDYAQLFSACSQRCAVSRYIGIGTFDTDSMKTGKLLQDDASLFDVVTKDYGWYNQYYRDCAYTKGEKMGYDVNFNKHYNHGVEIRFFDHIADDTKISDVLEDLIYLGDWALENDIAENPIKSAIWNGLVAKCMRQGKNTQLSFEELELYNTIFRTKFWNQDICSLYDEIIESAYSTNGKLFSKYAIKADESNMGGQALERRKIKGGGCCVIS